MRAQICQTFSPLFIGAQVSTPDSACYRDSERSFQSPLHRGTGFNVRAISHRSAAFCTFSPLFIGAQVSTHVDLCSDMLQSLPFSPLFIGAQVSTRHRADARAGNDALSVPSSSGHRFQLMRQHDDAASMADFQSPLHRGTGFNDLSRYLRHRLRSLSVPSSSGHRFQPLRSCLSR